MKRGVQPPKYNGSVKNGEKRVVFYKSKNFIIPIPLIDKSSKRTGD